MIVKTHIKLILNMLIYSLNFIGERERESTCDGELKNTTLKRMSPRQSLNNTMIHQYKVEL